MSNTGNVACVWFARRYWKRDEGTRDHLAKGEGRRSLGVNPSFTTGLVAEAKSSGLSLQYSVASYDEQI